MVLNTGVGSADVYSPDAARKKQWTVHWQRLALAVSQKEGVTQGRMLGVRATIFKGSATGVTVSADNGQGSKDQKQLELNGNVTVRSADRKSVLTCQSLRYAAGKELLYASGNVQLQNEVGSLGSFPMLVATSDLKKVATPKEFSLP